MGVRSLASLLLVASAVQAQTGGSFCASVICVNAVLNGNQVTYQLQSTLGFNELGWMAVGFGTSMINSPMVITWPNVDGTITISQRLAAAHALPSVVTNPPQVATLQWGNSMLQTNFTNIAFTYPAPSTPNAVNMIYAYSRARPASNSPNAVIERHTTASAFVMDLTQSGVVLTTGTFTVPSPTAGSPTTRYTTTSTAVGTGGSNSTPNSTTSTRLSPYQRKLVTHGILASIGFLILLPLGVFIPRYTRTVPALQNKWFTAHWVVQLLVAGPIIFAGWALGYQSTTYTGGGHFKDSHQRAGLALLVLYLIQLVIGIFIHYVKPKRTDAIPRRAKTESTGGLVSPKGFPAPMTSALKARPPQNYFHAILGLFIIALAFYNVREGYRSEFPTDTGIEGTKELKMANHWWISWVVIIPVLYLLGLALLPRQLRQESAARNSRSGIAPDTDSGNANLVPMQQANSTSKNSRRSP